MFDSLLIYRTPEWLKKVFSTITKSERNGPVFRFFMDLGDAGAMTVLFVSFLAFSSNETLDATCLYVL